MTRRDPVPPSAESRRDFLRTSAAAAIATGLAPLSAAARFQNRSAETLKVGLIGCGGRGSGAAVNALRADPNVELFAMADAFRDRLDASHQNLLNNPEVAAKVAVDDGHKFVGFDGYKGVINTCDVILFATSPHFRPAHVAYAVENGRHMFVEKPVATDGPGLRWIWESCRKAAEKRLSLVSGLCYRYELKKQETLRRIHDGAIGDITAMQCTYNTGGLWHRGREPGWSDMEWQMRNWLYFTWLSGDHIAEQHIHSLDKILWAMGDETPAKCTASGGRIVRTDPMYGNVYDHFNTVFEWESGVRGFSSCRQWVGAANNVSDHCFGTRGTAHIQRARIEGEDAWRWRSKDPDDMYQNEHDALFAAIRSDTPVNNGDYMCKATLMALMGRLAAYTGQEITWEQALNSQEDLSPAAYEWGPLETPPIARPGVTKFV